METVFITCTTIIKFMLVCLVVIKEVKSKILRKQTSKLDRLKKVRWTYEKHRPDNERKAIRKTEKIEKINIMIKNMQKTKVLGMSVLVYSPIISL